MKNRKNLYLKLNDKFADYVTTIDKKENLLDPDDFGDDFGIGYVLHFPNGYGASIIKFFGSYGYEQDKWELALLMKCGEGWDLCYTELVGGDVVGFLSDEEVNMILEKIIIGEVNCDLHDIIK